MTIKQLEKLWQKEYNRIQREIKKLAKQTEEISTIPMPRKPKRITEASVQRLKKIDTDYLKKKAKAILKEVSTQTNRKNVENEPRKPRTGIEDVYVRKGRTKKGKIQEQESETVTGKDRQGFKHITDEQRRKNLEKAREAQRKREAEDPEYAEAMRKKRAESLRKAREAQREREAEDPEYREAMRKKRAESLRKAREAKKNRKVQDIVEKLTDEIKKETTNDNEIDYEDLDNKIEEELSKISVEDEYEETPIGIDTETGEIDDKTLDIIEAINESQDSTVTDYEPDKDYSRSSGIIDSLKDLLENPATDLNKEYADVALRALDDIISYNEVNGTLQEWLESIERTPQELISNAEVISFSSDAGEVQQSATDFLIILYGSYSEIPESVLEASDSVKNYATFKAFNSSKFDMI